MLCWAGGDPGERLQRRNGANTVTYRTHNLPSVNTPGAAVTTAVIHRLRDGVPGGVWLVPPLNSLTCSNVSTPTNKSCNKTSGRHRSNTAGGKAEFWKPPVIPSQLLLSLYTRRQNGWCVGSQPTVDLSSHTSLCH